MAINFWRRLMSVPAVIWCALVGGLVGGLAGWLSAAVYVSPELAQIKTRLNQPIVVTSTTSQVEIVPVTRPAQTPSYPAYFQTRRVSPVVTLAKRTVNAPEETYAEDQELGRAVALTTDSWLVTDYAAFKTLKVAELVVLWQGQAYPIQKAIRDTATDAVFIKIQATGLPAPALVDTADLDYGLYVWTEPVPGRVYPETLVDLRSALNAEPISSERVQRRLIVSGTGEATPIGGAVWDERGQLLGIIESKTGGNSRVLPAADLRTALSSLLATDKIQHAVLGVRAVDLSALTPGGTPRQWPARGAWLKADKRSGLPAVNPIGPAGKLLKEGDVIERLERDVLDGTADLGERLLEYLPSAEVTVYGTRNGRQFQVAITLGSAVTGETLK